MFLQFGSVTLGSIFVFCNAVREQRFVYVVEFSVVSLGDRSINL
jgi:hypothetical protein